MGFQPVECSIMQITRKWIKKISGSYTLERTVLDNVENINHYQGFEIEHTSQQYLQKANNTTDFLRRIYEALVF